MDRQHQNILHIINGDSLNERLQSIHVSGEIAVWREMLCEGQTDSQIGSERFISLRKQFLDQHYQIDTTQYEEKFIKELDKIAAAKAYDAIYLWFEYDLFCHINMLAAISFLQQLRFEGSLHLVCSGKIEGEEQLLGLAQLNDELLARHYKEAITLSESDLRLADGLWKLYCHENHDSWNPDLVEGSAFAYLAQCMAAHKRRFPSVVNGLNTIEQQLLKLIDTYKINSLKQWCGYGLSYQGYYGYGDLQIKKLINDLSIYYERKNGYYTLTTFGKQLISNKATVASNSISDIYYGGALKWSFYYNPATNSLQTEL